MCRLIIQPDNICQSQTEAYIQPLLHAYELERTSKRRNVSKQHKAGFFFFIIISSEETSREENTEKVLAEAKPAQSPGFNVSSSCFCKPHTHTHTHSVPNIAPSQYVLISHLSPQVVASLTELLNQQIFLTWAHFLLILVNRTRFKWNPDVFIFPTLRRLNDLQTPDVVVVWCLSCLTVCHPESLLITQCPALTLRVSHEFKRLNTASVLMCVLVYLQCRSGSRGLSQVLYSSSWWYLAACLHLCCRWFDVVFILRGTS